MKIGVLTFHKSINYGSVLQAWATQELLKKAGYSVEIIDYEPKVYKKANEIFLSGKGLGVIVKNLLRIPVVKYKKNQRNKFELFRKEFLNMSDFKVDYTMDYKELEEKYDCFICGSDQIWNVHAVDCDDIYFLPDIRKKKIALAVSVNNTTFSEPRCDENLRRWISDFSLISCREERGAKRLYNFLNGKNNVHTLLDPTLLHEKEDYNSICNSRLINEDYIFLYKVWSGKESYKMVTELGKKLGLPIYTLFMYNNVLALSKVEFTGIHVIKSETSPKDYLSLIRYANLVVTDSFHGTSFSIIFEKQFICVREKKPDGTYKDDDRLLNILNVVGLDDRYVSLENIKSYNLEESINYSEVTRKRLSIAKDNIELVLQAINN